MWIFLGIVLFIVLLITIILLLPFSFIIKTDQKGELVLLYKFLFKTFGENPNPNQPIVKILKDLSGVNQLSAKRIKESSKKGELTTVLHENLNLIINILKELLRVLKGSTVKKLKIDVVCAEDDAAETALAYGTCYAVISPLLNLIHNTMKVKRRNEKINITPDFNSQKGSFEINVILVTRVYKLVVALLKLAMDQAKRAVEEDNQTVTKKS